MADRVEAVHVEHGRFYAVLLVSVKFAELHSDRENVNLHSGVSSLDIGGTLYQGVGQLGEIGEIVETQGTEGQEFDLRLTAASDELTEAFFEQDYAGVPVEVKLATSEGGVVWSADDVFDLKRGRISHATIDASGITISCFTPMTDLIEPLRYDRRYTHADQQLVAEGDDIFRFVESIEQKEIDF